MIFYLSFRWDRIVSLVLMKSGGASLPPNDLGSVAALRCSSLLFAALGRSGTVADGPLQPAAAMQFNLVYQLFWGLMRDSEAFNLTRH